MLYWRDSSRKAMRIYLLKSKISDIDELMLQLSKPSFCALSAKFLIGISIALGVVGSAAAGTYSIVDIEWYPSNSPGVGTQGGYIKFSTGQTFPYDLLYGITTTTATGPTSSGANSQIINPAITGVWRWKIQWVGSSPSDPVPDGVNATVEVKGSSSVTVGAAWYTGENYYGQGQGQLNDPYYPITLQNAVADESYPYSSPTPATNSGSNLLQAGAGPFTLVSGTTYIGYVGFTLSSGASLTGSGAEQQTGTGKGGSPIYEIFASGSASTTLSATLRLVSIAGQTLQANL